jgi:hypothetical protein
MGFQEGGRFDARNEAHRLLVESRPRGIVTQHAFEHRAAIRAERDPLLDPILGPVCGERPLARIRACPPRRSPIRG